MTQTTDPPALAITAIDYITVRPCPTCATPMEQHGRAWACPRQRDEERRVSAELRAVIQADARAIDTACGF